MELDPPRTSCPICGGALRSQGVKRDPVKGDRYRYDRCVACAFLFVNPRPTLRALADWYRHSESPREVNSSETWSKDPLKLREYSIDPARLTAWGTRHLRSAGRRMLDVGAGFGLLSREAQRRGFAVTALELDEHAAGELERKYGLEVVRVPFEEFAPERPFDLIVLNQVLEHAHDPVAWARKLAQSAAPGGVVVLSMPHARSFWQALIGLKDPYVKPPLHLNHFGLRSLRLLLEGAGLRLLASQTYSRIPWDLVSRKARVPRALRPPVDWLFRHAQQVPLALVDRCERGVFLEVCATPAERHKPRNGSGGLTDV